MPSTPPDLSRLSVADRSYGQRLHNVLGGKVVKSGADSRVSLKPVQGRFGIADFVGDSARAALLARIEQAYAPSPASTLPAPTADVPAPAPQAQTASPAVPLCSKILGNLLSAQRQYLPAPDYLKRVQRDEITQDMRRDIVAWLHKLNRHFEFHPETFTLAVNYFDRMLGTVRVKPAHVQLIAVSCLLVAGKMQEAWDSYPTLRELSIASDNAFSCNDIMRMEKIVLGKLGWDTNAVSPHVVLHQLVEHLPVDADTRRRVMAEAEAYVDLSYYEYGFLRYLPSTIACCAVACVLARRGRAEDVQMLPLIRELTATPVEDAEACFVEMRSLAVDVAPAL